MDAFTESSPVRVRKTEPSTPTWSPMSSRSNSSQSAAERASIRRYDWSRSRPSDRSAKTAFFPIRRIDRILPGTRTVFSASAAASSAGPSMGPKSRTTSDTRWVVGNRFG